MSALHNVSFLQDEQERVKRLQPPIAQPLPIQPPPEKTFALNGSIAPSALEERAPQFQPVLPSIDYTYNSPMPRLLKCLEDQQLLMEDIVDAMEIEAEHPLQQLRELHEQLQAAMQEELKVSEFESKWRIWETVLQYVTAASSLLIGIGILASNGDTGAGACLVAAGGLSLANQILIDTDGWEALIQCFVESAEKQKTIAERIQAGVFLLSMSLTLTGTVLAIKNDQLIDALPKEKILKITHLAIALLQGGTSLVRGAIKQRSSTMQARIIRTHASMMDHRKTLGLLTSSQNELWETGRQIAEVVKKAIQQTSTSD